MRKVEDVRYDILKSVSEATSNLLPSKSKEKYEQCYRLFCQWRTDNKLHGNDENIVLAYFYEKSKSFKSSTLWSIYSMLKSTLQIYENVDISVYSKLLAYLKRQNDGYVVKKSKILTSDHVRMFLTTADDESFLFIKVALIFALRGACRSDELLFVKVQDSEDAGTVLIVTLHYTKTKKKMISIVISQIENVNELALYRKYLSLRPKHIDHHRLFIFYSKGKCTVQPIRINTFCSLPRKIAEYLKLPDASSYPRHCLRRTSATLLADSGADMQTLKRHGGWRSSNVVEGYIEDSIANKVKTSSRNFNQMNDCEGSSSIGVSCVPSPVAAASSETMSNSTTISDIQSVASSSGIIFNNLHNCTFNLCIDKLKK